MLNEMRSGATGFFVKLLLGLLVVMFVFWGIHGVDFATGEPVATVGKQRIDAQQFEREVGMLKRSFGAELGGQGALVQLMKLALNDMIGRRLLAQEAERNDLLISDDVLAVQIGRNSAFQSASGDFDKTAFQQRLRENSLTESQYLQQLASGLQQSLLVNVIAGHSLVPKGYAGMLHEIEDETRTIDLVAVGLVPADAVSSPDDAQIARYYEQHAADYEAPEYRSLGIVRLDAKAIESSVEVDREEVFSLFNARRESLMIPEKRHVLQLLYTNKADAENAYGLLRSGKSVAQVAEQIAPTNQGAIDLGYVTREQIPTGSGPIFALARDEFTQPIESPFGWHVFTVRDVRERHATDFEEVRKTLEDEVRQQKAEALLAETTQKLDDAVAGTNDLADAAKQAGLAYTRTPPVDATGLGGDGKPVLATGQDKEILATGFRLPVGERSELMRTGNDLYVVKVESSTPPRRRELAEVRGAAAESWKKEARLSAAKVRAEALAADLAAATPERRKALLAGKGIDVTKHLSLRRDGSVTGIDGTRLPAALVRDVFATEPGRATTVHPFEDRGYAMAFVERVDPPATGGASREGAQVFARGLSKDFDNEVYSQYLAQLRQRFPVRVDDAMLGQMIERK